MSNAREADARAFVARLTAGDFAVAASAFDAVVRAAMPALALEQTWGALTAQVGALGAVESTRTEVIGAHTIVFVTCAFAATRLDVKVAFDASGAIAGLFFVPSPVPYAPPSYADLAKIEERDEVVGDDEWALPATLTLPRALPKVLPAAVAGGASRAPAVVLVHGSGPGDRDETIGACKPFRDLALGLATLGVAVLAYDKRTRMHAAKLSDLSAFTVEQETVLDAVRAVERLRRRPEVDPARVSVVGHSLGGHLAPRIAKRAPEVRGIAILAGSTRPIPAMMLEQLRYIAALDPSAAPSLAPRIAAVEEAAARIDALVAGAEPRPGEVLLGAGAAYWRDLAAYDALATARSIPQPIFVAQGGRDYQVTEVDFAGWKAALDGRPGTRFALYPALNHALGAGEGPSHPGEYEQRAEVAEELVRDLAAWIALAV